MSINRDSDSQPLGPGRKWSSLISGHFQASPSGRWQRGSDAFASSKLTSYAAHVPPPRRSSVPVWRYWREPGTSAAEKNNDKKQTKKHRIRSGVRVHRYPNSRSLLIHFNTSLIETAIRQHSVQRSFSQQRHQQTTRTGVIACQSIQTGLTWKQLSNPDWNQNWNWF